MTNPRHPQVVWALVAAFVVFSGMVLAVSAVMAESPAPSDPGTSAKESKEAEAKAAVPVPAAVDAYPNTPIGAHARWLVHALTNGGEGATEQAVLAYHTDEFFADVTAADLTETIRTMSMLVGKGKLKRLFSHKPTSAFVRIEAAGGTLQRLSMTCQPKPPHRLTSWQLTPDPSPAYDTAPADWDGFDRALTMLARDTGYVLAEIGDDGLRVIRERNPGRLANVASVHKLYTLGELCRQVEAGKVAWDDTMLLQEKLKVGGSGELQHVAAGTTLTLRELAEKMISVSDNTATDHLLSLLGRGNIEAVLPVMGHSNPAAALPFMSVREVFALMGTKDASIPAAWRAADLEGRRGMLAKELLDPGELVYGAKPRNIDIAGWYMSPMDMAQAITHLKGKFESKGLEPLSDILRAPAPYPRKGWKDMYFKGGSTTGVLAGAWLLQDQDGKWYAWCVAANDPARALDEMLGIELFLEGVGIVRSGLGENGKGTEGGK